MWFKILVLPKYHGPSDAFIRQTRQGEADKARRDKVRRFSKVGIEASIIIDERNFTAPGPGAAADSVSKAGVTQLSRVTALEKSASRYGMSIEDYKTTNFLGTEISFQTLATSVSAVAGLTFYVTTGGQIPVDGRNDWVI